MANSTLSLTVTQSKKTVVAVGVVAVKEPVNVTVIGGAQYISGGLVLRLQGLNNHGLTTPVAQYPLTVGGVLQTWTTSGLNATATLNLNTDELNAAFVSVANLGFKTFNLLLFTETGPVLAANGVLSVMNFPASVTADPVTISQATTIDAISDRLSLVEAQLTVTPTFEDFEAIRQMPMTNDRERTAVITAMLNALTGN